MLHQNQLLDLSIASVKEACHAYFTKKDLSLFFNNACMKDIPMIGITNPSWSEEFVIESEHFQTYRQTPTLCMVHGRLLINDKLQPSPYGQVVDVTVLCTYVDDKIKYSSIHVTLPKKSIINTKAAADDSYYYNFLCHMYDVILEYRLNDNVFTYDKTKYMKFFHRDCNFITMDQWFWDFCTNHLYPEDGEKLDLFRDIDIKKRIENNEDTIETVVRLRRDDTDDMWIKITFVLFTNEDKQTIERVFILIKDYTNEMNIKMMDPVFAGTDPLTQVWNRDYSQELISDCIKEKGRGLFAVIDIDNFKDLNDTFGHITGDKILKKVADFISGNLIDGDIFGRLFADKFVLYLNDDFDDALMRFTNIIDNVGFEHKDNDTSQRINCNAGVTSVKNTSTSFNALYKTADIALFQSKKFGDSNYKVK